jgi:AmmeMemoRadiSam system protein B
VAFYDADPRVLASTVDRLLQRATPSVPAAPRGLIVPHAAALASGAVADERPHAFEHALEVELPFLQRVLRSPRILPVAVGHARAEDVAETIAAVAPLADLLVVSTDLSHYRDAETARRLDRRTADAVLERDAGAIGPEDACGRYALRGALAWARAADAPIALLDLRNSGDTSGEPGPVVGYGAFAIG